MKEETFKKISKDFDRLGDIDFTEGETLVVKDAIELIKASIVYQLYEVTDDDDNGVYMLQEYTEALDILNGKNPEAKVKIWWVEMGAFVIKDEGEE